MFSTVAGKARGWQIGIAAIVILINKAQDKISLGADVLVYGKFFL
jgi:hypothetical protein